MTTTARTTADSTALVVDFCGELHRVEVDDSLAFGRSAALTIDDNPYLHRTVGSFSWQGGWWWLHNRGSRIHLTIKDLTSRTHVALAPGRDLALTFPRALVQFSAGRQHYEIEISLPDPLAVNQPGPAARLDDNRLGDHGATISLADLPLTVDQRRLVVALAEPTLISGDPEIRLPSNRAAAVRLGWTITRFNRKLDNVCQRLHKAGVSGLRGDVATLAADRRLRLVSHALESGLIDHRDLELLPPPLKS